MSDSSLKEKEEEGDEQRLDYELRKKKTFIPKAQTKRRFS